MLVNSAPGSTRKDIAAFPNVTDQFSESASTVPLIRGHAGVEDG